MTKLIAAAALIAAIASPALAQTAVPPPAQFNAQTNVRTDGQRHSVNPGYDVYQSGRYIGSDPDAGIRTQLLRDSYANDY
jgi:opacity protein-like surface antigen